MSIAEHTPLTYRQQETFRDEAAASAEQVADNRSAEQIAQAGVISAHDEVIKRTSDAALRFDEDIDKIRRSYNGLFQQFMAKATEYQDAAAERDRLEGTGNRLDADLAASEDDITAKKNIISALKVSVAVFAQKDEEIQQQNKRDDEDLERLGSIDASHEDFAQLYAELEPMGGVKRTTDEDGHLPTEENSLKEGLLKQIEQQEVQLEVLKQAKAKIEGSIRGNNELLRQQRIKLTRIQTECTDLEDALRRFGLEFRVLSDEDRRIFTRAKLSENNRKASSDTEGNGTVKEGNDDVR